jgi:hypothetical protein
MVAPRQLERLFDLRTVRRNIRGGLITKERYEEWLKTLPDAADNVATVSFEDEEREARRQASPRFPVISPTRPLVSAPFDDDDDDDDYDDEDEDVDGDEATAEADEADEDEAEVAAAAGAGAEEAAPEEAAPEEAAPEEAAPAADAGAAGEPEAPTDDEG